VAHRNIKASNVLLDDRGDARLCDSGIAKLFQAGSRVLAGKGARYFQIHYCCNHPSYDRDTHSRLSPGYMDPEYLNSLQYTKSSDIFSFGVVVLQLLTSRPAFVESRFLTRLVVMSLGN